MTSSLGSEPGSGGGGDWQDTNGDEPSKPKRMRLNEGDQYIVCDFDILGATDCVLSSINVEDVLQEQICKYSRLNLANLESEFLEIDAAFDKMEYQMQKLKEIFLQRAQLFTRSSRSHQKSWRRAAFHRETSTRPESSRFMNLPRGLN